MASLVFNVALLGAGVYFYIDGNHAAAFLAFGVLAFRILRSRIAQIWSNVTRLQTVPEEHEANVQLTCRISVEQVLRHAAIDQLFRNLQERNKAPAGDVEAWRGQLSENYLRTFNRSQPFEELTFNIKNNLVFKDGTPDFADAIHHTLVIPYSLSHDGETHERSIFTSSVEVGLEIRLLMVNGALLLQIGAFDKEASPHVIRDGSLSVYQTYVTITSFPFLYFAGRHALPVRYMSLSASATDSYKNALGDPQRKHRLVDWREIQATVASYRILIDDHSSNYSYSKIEALASSFEAKRNALLAREEFADLGGDRSEHWRYPDLGETFANKYLYVHFRDLNQWREGMIDRATRDYYEEQP